MPVKVGCARKVASSTLWNVLSLVWASLHGSELNIPEVQVLPLDPTTATVLGSVVGFAM